MKKIIILLMVILPIKICALDVRVLNKTDGTIQVTVPLTAIGRASVSGPAAAGYFAGLLTGEKCPKTKETFTLKKGEYKRLHRKDACCVDALKQIKIKAVSGIARDKTLKISPILVTTDKDEMAWYSLEMSMYQVSCHSYFVITNKNGGLGVKYVTWQEMEKERKGLK